MNDEFFDPDNGERRRRSERAWGSPLAEAATAPRPQAPSRRGGSSAARARPSAWPLAYLSLIALLPLAAVVARSAEDGAQAFWDAVTDAAGAWRR